MNRNSSHASRTILGPGARIQGRMELDNDTMLLGSMEGVLRVDGRLDFGQAAEVKGLVICRTLRLAGRIEADIIALEAVELLANARLQGQLRAQHLMVCPGAELLGPVNIGRAALEKIDDILSAHHAECDAAWIESILAKGAGRSTPEQWQNGLNPLDKTSGSSGIDDGEGSPAPQPVVVTRPANPPQRFSRVEAFSSAVDQLLGQAP